MKAVIQHHYGGAETLQLCDVPTPTIGRDQVLVRVAAAGVDRGAYHLMRGLPYVVRLGTGIRRPKAAIPGTNVAGEVESVGENVTRLRAGDLVYGTSKGSFAEYAVAGEDRLAPKPPTLSFEEAAVLPYAAVVSLQAVRDRANVRSGQSVLVVGASGAVGSVTVQIAKAHEAIVTGVCGSGSAELVRALGADHVIDYTSSDFAAEGHRYDAIIDIGGNTRVSRLRRALASRGTLVIVGGEGGGRLIGGIHRQLGAQLLSPFVKQRLGTLIARERSDVLRAVNDLVDAGFVAPVMGRYAPLAHATDAIADLDAGRTRGRIALVP
jgi:NADPH:quinone reductase-like Zn-dependent oxidoreductase